MRSPLAFAALLAVTSAAMALASKDCDTRAFPSDGSGLKPVRTPTPVVDLKWAGAGDDTDRFVFAVTEAGERAMGGRLFWSDDFGAAPSWKDATPRLEGALASSPGLPPAMRGVVDVFAHADAPCRLLVQGAGALHWTTADCGRTFTPAPAPAGTAGWFADFKLHPTQPSWILSKVRRAECHRRGAAGSKWCAYDLFVSQDFAGTWTNLTAASGGAVASFWDYDWGANLLKAGRAPGSAVKDATIFATAYESARHMKGPYPGWDKDMHFVASHDFFRSAHAKVASCGNQFEVVGRTLYLAMPADCPVHPDGSARPKRAAGGGGGGGGPGGGSNVVLYTSADEGATWLQACLPVKWMDLGYSLVRTHDAASALVVVDHDEEDPAAAAAPAGNVYSPGSGETGAPIFTLALPRTYRTASASDFARVEGLPGVFMANQIDGDAFAGGGGAGKPGRRAFESYVRTRVSFNGGARWQDLAPPADPRHAACRRCVPDAGDGDGGASCALHLHGPSSWHDGPGGRPSFYSHANAPGVVMAVGNAGRHLDRAADALCTWMSRDGGVSWSDVAPRASIYEFGDHGGLLAMARHEVDGPAESISFSSDQGACWHEVHLAEAIDVQNIRIEPRGASHVFIVHGKACRRSPTHQACGWDAAGGGAGGGGAASSPPGRMYVLDVRTLMGPDWRECGAGDYERWAPAAAAGGCLLGANVTVERRVGAAQCFNGREYVRSNGTAPGKSGRAASPSDAAPPCPCTLNDVECEYGYERAGADCVPIAGFDLGAAAGRCAALGGGRFGGASHAPYRASTTKRRLVHGDTCSGVSSVIPDTDGRGHGRGMGRAGGLLKGLAWAVAGVATLAGVAAAAAAVRGGGGGGPAALSTASAIAGGLAESASSFLASTAGRVADAVSGSRAGGAARAAAADAFFQPLAGGEGEGTALLAPGGGELGGLSAADLAAAEVI